MREANRTLQLKLRDIEVANDDYERQARNTTSSLEDVEAKYNQAIERGVMLEEELRVGEQEREALRIETQRLRDELSDLRIEAEITQEKLRLAEATIERFHTQRAQPLESLALRPRSPASEASPTTASSPTISTPPPSKSETSITSDAPTPPSPPLSDASVNPNSHLKTPIAPPFKRRSLIPDTNNTPRTSVNGSRIARHSRGPSITFASGKTIGGGAMLPPPRSIRPTMPPSMQTDGVPRSGSLYQIKGLIGRMQKIEERVHNVRSKLPPSDRRSPRNSPRTGTGRESDVPSSITMRSRTKRVSTSTSSSVKHEDDVHAQNGGRSTNGHVRQLSFGVAPAGATGADRPASGLGRPHSRISSVSHSATSQYGSRPPSRSSIGGARTPVDNYATLTGAERRPRSSIGGNYNTTHATPRHGHTSSMSTSHSRTMEEEEEPATPSARRKSDRTSIPTPSSKTLPRKSGGFSGPTVTRRPSLGYGLKNSDGQESAASRQRKLSEVGETY